MNRTFASFTLFALTVATSAAAFANDAFTGLPLDPNVGDKDPATISAVCYGTNHVRSSLFSWKTTTPAPAVAAWYQNALPGSKLQRHTIDRSGAKFMEFIVLSADGTSRVEVNDLLGRTLMRLTHAQRPINFGDDSRLHCQSTM